MSSSLTKTFMIAFVVLLVLPLVLAATQTDTLDADFALGNSIGMNASNDSVMLGSNGTGGYNASSIFYSRVFNLGSNPTATISWNFTTPSGTSILVSTRSGNDNSSFATWSGWSGDYLSSSGTAVTSPQARFYQYRAQLATTNTSVTPTLEAVTLTYTEANASIGVAQAYQTNLTTQSTGSYVFYAQVNDTIDVVNVTARYSVGTGSSFSTSTDMDSVASGIYNITIPQPSGNWSNYSNQNVTVEVTAVSYDNISNRTTAANLTELVDFVNNPPTIDPIANYTVAQDQNLNFTVTASDLDSAQQTLIFTTNLSSVIVTSLTNTSALLSWTPNATEIGNFTIIVTANDTYTTATRSYNVNVTGVNHPPTINSVASITGYHGIMQSLALSGYDPDNNANISFSVIPDFFTLETDNSNASSGNYYSEVNFVPADPEDGVNNVTFVISDGQYSANTTTTMSISYCGDQTCDSSYENETSCPVDCKSDVKLESIALVVPDRNCVNQTMTIYTYNATDRFSCYYQGRVQGDYALCDPLDGVSVTALYSEGFKLTNVGSLSSDSNGAVTFTPQQEGQYKFSGTKDGYYNTSTVVYVRACDDDIVTENKTYVIQQPNTGASNNNNNQGAPQTQEPSPVTQQTSALSIILFYFIVPLLLAVLTYSGVVFYDVNKDTLPWILETRIFVYEKQVEYAPQINTVKKAVMPYAKPAWEALEVIYELTLEPVIKWIRDTLKKIQGKP